MNMGDCQLSRRGGVQRMGFIVFFFGCVHIVNVGLGYLPLIHDDPAAFALDWSQPNQASTDIAAYLLDITKDVTPIPCHSHNDYWRRVPLYDALRWGCTGVEADVWLFDEDLFVGHSTHALTKNRTFRSMYVDPLTKMLDYKNDNTTSLSTVDVNANKSGVFDTAPQQTLVLLVDFKNNGSAIFPYVSAQLAALREKGYLTYYNGTSTIEGPITVVATGNAPFDMVVANSTYRDIFFDAPLDRLYVDPGTSDSLDQSQYDDTNSTAPTPSVSTSGQGTVGTSPDSHFDSSNSFYASTNFKKSIGRIWWGHMTTAQKDLIRGQIKGAHERGLKVRYWGAPKWPIALRNRVWWDLVEMGVDYLNGDDLVGMTKFDWSVRRHWGWFE
ncbi:Altered inheritance of mitochondria protein 6 [Curvularia kusanoi]|uniref:Altered inheritance of mitochondria protein 6 n=1 Tax=Curvularia kusanoi TaxID=90978 RepID=A0A9P4T660_CURKU|nr:Altered inheritance of mitochondria protein 6 [Curvularia kusanoi]